MNRTVQTVAKDLMLISYSAVCSYNTMQGGNASQAIASPMFDALLSCAKECPMFLLSLSQEGQPMGEVICSSTKSTLTTLKLNDMDIIVSSARFLIELVCPILCKVLDANTHLMLMSLLSFTFPQISSLKSLSLESFEEDQRESMASIVGTIKHTVQNDVIATVVQTTCAGISPQGALLPLIDLLQEILLLSQWSDIEASVSITFESGPFQLGAQATAVALRALQKSAENTYIPSNFRTIISDMWDMHQTDDTGIFTGSEDVLDFVQRYSAD